MIFSRPKGDWVNSNHPSVLRVDGGNIGRYLSSGLVLSSEQNYETNIFWFPWGLVFLFFPILNMVQLVDSSKRLITNNRQLIPIGEEIWRPNPRRVNVVSVLTPLGRRGHTSVRHQKSYEQCIIHCLGIWNWDKPMCLQESVRLRCRNHS